MSHGFLGIHIKVYYGFLGKTKNKACNLSCRGLLFGLPASNRSMCTYNIDISLYQTQVYESRYHSCEYEPKHMWRFPEMEVPLFILHLNGIFHYKPSIHLGVAPFMEPPVKMNSVCNIPGVHGPGLPELQGSCSEISPSPVASNIHSQHVG